MKITFYKPSNTDFSFELKFTPSELAEYEIYAATETEADFIICSWLKDLIPYIIKHQKNKKYCLWTDEPLWTNVQSTPPLYRSEYFWCNNGQIYEQWVPDSISIIVMNCYTSDVYFSNHHFLNSDYSLDRSSLTKILKNKPRHFTQDLKLEDKKIVALQTYRNGERWDFKSDLMGTLSLCNLRSNVVLEGAMAGFVDVFGQGWPIQGISKGDTRFTDEWWKVKCEIMKDYFFAFCFENCVVHNYVTEKIWHAISVGVLPIYYAGPGHSIYRDFPRNSFIDYHEFSDPVSCWNFVCSMTPTEYYRRLSLCIDAMESAIKVSDEGRIPRRLQLQALQSRLKTVASEKLSFPISVLIQENAINWPVVLGKSNPVILDIGANDGGTSAFFISSFPEAQVFSFEPDPRAISRFKSRYLNAPSPFSKIELFEGVLSDIVGELNFYQSDGNNPSVEWYESGWDLSGSIKKPTKHTQEIPSITFRKTITVSSTTLDFWMETKSLEIIDLAWIDVQGAERNVIVGAQHSLSVIRYIHIEYSANQLYEGQMDLPGLLALLPDFEVLQVYRNDVLLKNRNLL